MTENLNSAYEAPRIEVLSLVEDFDHRPEVVAPEPRSIATPICEQFGSGD